MIRVGGATEVEVKERKDRVDDAMHATRAAVEEGILPGGGVALLRASEVLKKVRTQNDDQKTGVEIVRKALSWLRRARSPSMRAKTARSSSARSSRRTSTSYGFDAQNGEYVNLVTEGHHRPHESGARGLAGSRFRGRALITTGGDGRRRYRGSQPLPMPGGGGGGMGGMGGMDF